MTPAQPPAERPGVVCRCGKPGRAGGPAPRPRRRAVRGGAGASYRAAPASSSPETATVEVNPPASTARNPAAAPVLRGLPGAPGDRPGRHYPGQPGGGDHHAGHGPPGQRYTGGGQQPPLCRCAAASDATSTATVTPSQDTRSPPACANAARTSLAAPGARTAAAATTPMPEPTPRAAAARCRPHSLAGAHRHPVGCSVPGRVAASCWLAAGTSAPAARRRSSSFPAGPGRCRVQPYVLSSAREPPVLRCPALANHRDPVMTNPLPGGKPESAAKTRTARLRRST